MRAQKSLKKNIAEIDEVNRLVRANLDKDKAEDDAKQYQQQYNELTSKINKIREEKNRTIKPCRITT